MSNIKPGAGIIIYCDNRNNDQSLHKDILYLTLIVKDKVLDLPKGALDEGEEFLDCAIRETFEECGLKNKIHYQLIENPEIDCGDYLKIYVAKFLHDYSRLHDFVEILPNEKTGIIEHEDACWLTKDQLLSGEFGKLYSYLKSPLNKAENLISLL